MSARLGSDDRARLDCDHGNCLHSFTRHHVSANATRIAAEKVGWDVAVRDDRRDFCPDHKGMDR